jgi:hypothetical protein
MNPVGRQNSHGDRYQKIAVFANNERGNARYRNKERRVSNQQVGRATV